MWSKNIDTFVGDGMSMETWEMEQQKISAFYNKLIFNFKMNVNNK